MPILTARLAARVHQWVTSVAACVSKPHYQRIATMLLGCAGCLVHPSAYATYAALRYM